MFFTKRLMFFSACNAVRRIFFESAFMQAKTKKCAGRFHCGAPL